jgi:hypothetical protein
MGPKQNQRKQLKKHAFIEPKSNQDRLVVKATTSANRAVKGEGDAFSIRAPKGK